MIALGIVILVLGAQTRFVILWSLGVLVLVFGLVLWILGAVGHAVGGRRHYY